MGHVLLWLSCAAWLTLHLAGTGCAPALVGASAATNGGRKQTALCEREQTGTIQLRNQSPDAAFDVLVDGILAATLARSEEKAVTRPAGQHSVEFRFAGLVVPAAPPVTLALFACRTEVASCSARNCVAAQTGTIEFANRSPDASFDVQVDDRQVATVASNRSTTVSAAVGRRTVSFLFAGTSQVACPAQVVEVATCAQSSVSCSARVCLSNGTARFTFGNASSCTSYDIVWDGARIMTLGAGESQTRAVAAGAHSLDFKFAGTNRLACSTSTPSLAVCQDTGLQCSQNGGTFTFQNATITNRTYDVYLSNTLIFTLPPGQTRSTTVMPASYYVEVRVGTTVLCTGPTISIPACGVASRMCAL